MARVDPGLVETDFIGDGNLMRRRQLNRVQGFGARILPGYVEEFDPYDKTGRQGDPLAIGDVSRDPRLFARRRRRLKD